MAALTAERDTPRRDGVDYEFPVAASSKLFKGGMVMINASSLAVKGAAATGQKCVGIAKETADNSAGSASAINVKVARGVYRFGNSADSDLIALTDIGADCYIVDDQTVAKTNGSSSRSVAGKIRSVDATGVWVEI